MASAIVESVYNQDSFDNTEQHLYDITEQSSEDDTRIGAQAYNRFYQRYKKSYKYAQLQKKPTKRNVIRSVGRNGALNTDRNFMKTATNGFPTTERRRLEILNLENNDLKDKGVKIICQAFANNQDSIKKLNLSKNNITDFSIIDLALLIQNNSSLKELTVHWNKLTGNGLNIIVKSLQQNKKIKILDLSWNALGSYNKIGDYTVGKCLGEYLRDNKSLVHLDLSFNGICKPDCIEIGEGLKDNHTLLGIHLRGNDGTVDTLGFIRESKEKTKGYDINKADRVYDVPFYKRIEDQQKLQRSVLNQSMTKLFKNGGTSELDNCWLCERWHEHQFVFHYNRENEISDFPKPVITIHFEFEEYEPQKMAVSSHDESTFILWKMIPPGKHLYYFTVNSNITIKETDLYEESTVIIQQEKQEVALEKVNILNIPRTNHQIIDKGYRSILKHCVPRPLVVEVVDDVEEEHDIIKPKTPWSVGNSIFREYKVDNDDIVRQCFEFDWNCMRKPKFENAQAEIEIKNELSRGYKIIKNLYRPMSALGMIGNVFSIGLNVYTELLRENLALVDGESLKLNDIDMLFIVVNSIRKGEYNPANGLVRYQFLEILMRLALKKYYISGLTSTQGEAVAKLVDKHLNPIQSQILFQNNGWRSHRYWNEGCDNILRAFRPLLENIYNRYGGTHKKPGEKTYMTVDEFEKFIIDAGLCNDLLFSRDVCVCFNLAMMTQVNEITKDRHMRATFIEFLEALARAVDKASPLEQSEEIDMSKIDQSPFQRRLSIKESLSQKDASPTKTPILKPTPIIKEQQSIESDSKATSERVNRPLNMKLKVFMDMILANCVVKAFKEKYEYPVFEDEQRYMFVVRN